MSDHSMCDEVADLRLQGEELPSLLAEHAEKCTRCCFNHMTVDIIDNVHASGAKNEISIGLPKRLKEFASEVDIANRRIQERSQISVAQALRFLFVQPLSAFALVLLLLGGGYMVVTLRHLSKNLHSVATTVAEIQQHERSAERRAMAYTSKEGDGTGETIGHDGMVSMLRQIADALERRPGPERNGHTVDLLSEYLTLTRGTMLYTSKEYKNASLYFERLFEDKNAKHGVVAGFALGTCLKHLSSEQSLVVYEKLISRLESNVMGLPQGTARNYLASAHHFAGYAAHCMFRESMELPLQAGEFGGKRSVLYQVATGHLAIARSHYAAAARACAPRRYYKLEYNDRAWLTMDEAKLMGLVGDVKARSQLLSQACTALTDLCDDLAEAIKSEDGRRKHRLQWTLAQAEMLRGPHRYRAASEALASGVAGIPLLGRLVAEEPIFDPIQGAAAYKNACAKGDEAAATVREMLPRDLFFDVDLEPEDVPVGEDGKSGE